MKGMMRILEVLVTVLHQLASGEHSFGYYSSSDTSDIRMSAPGHKGFLFMHVLAMES